MGGLRTPATDLPAKGGTDHHAAKTAGPRRARLLNARWPAQKMLTLPPPSDPFTVTDGPWCISLSRADAGKIGPKPPIPKQPPFP